jgi:hypothetical protein
MPNAWDKFFGKQWDQNKKWDPLTHGLLEAVVKQDSHNIAAIDHGISKMFGGDGSTVLGDEARKNENDPKRGIGRAAATVGLMAGAYYGLGAGAGGSAGGAGAGAGGAGSAGAGGATNAALIDSYLGTAGYGASSAGAGGGAGGAAAGSSNGFDWTRMGQQMQGMGDDGQGGGADDITQVDLAALAMQEEMRRRELDAMATSSKKAKTPGGGLADLSDPIDHTGAQIAAIKHLAERASALRTRLAALKKGK